MTQKRKNPAGEGGVRCTYDGRHSPDLKPPCDKTQFQPCADECIYRLHRALRAGRIGRDSWGFNFTRSVLKHSKRPAWVPSPKQLSAMRRLVAELAEPDMGPLIDDGGDDERAA